MPDRSRRAMTAGWWVLLILGVVVAGGAVVWLGAQNDPDGAPLIENPGGVIVAIIGGSTAVLAVVLPQVLAIKHEVKNDHTVPMRDDLDDKHSIIIRAIEGLASDLRGVRRDIGRNSNQIYYLAQRLDKQIDRIDELEDTQQPGKDPP